MEIENIKAREIQQNFKTELEALLNKYKAEIIIENDNVGWYGTDYITVEFAWNEELYNLTNETGIVPSLRI